MSPVYLIAAYVVIFIIQFAAFGMQRASLLLSRQTGVPYEVCQLLLPAWFAATRLVTIAKYALAIYIAFSWSWVAALSLVVADFVLSGVIPIPYHVYYPIFRHRIKQHKMTDPEMGEALEKILEAVPAIGEGL